MKALNPSTGTLETVYVKALDSLPVGAEIDFTGADSDIPLGWEKVDCYSTSEVNTGKTWIDGKSIYRKVINFGALPNTNAKSTAHSISNLGNIISVKGWTKRSDGTTFPIPYVSGNNVIEDIAVYTNNTNVVIYCGTNRTEFSTTYITLEYTKSS